MVKKLWVNKKRKDRAGYNDDDPHQSKRFLGFWENHMQTARKAVNFDSNVHSHLILYVYNLYI